MAIAPPNPTKGRSRSFAAFPLLLAGLASMCGPEPPPSDGVAREMLLSPDHPDWQTPAPPVFRVRFLTSQGPFVVEAHRAWAPLGVDRFYHLVRYGFYERQKFFRVRAGFIAQFGIHGEPTIAAHWRDRALPDDAVVESNRRGYLAYAMTGPNTRTTQIYINYADNSRLDEQGFAPFARVIEGMEVVDSLYAGYDEDAGGGMRGGQQGPLFEGGNEFLAREFPKLDSILRVELIPN